MNKLLMLKGLPASGKSTYAFELAQDGNWVRINKDDLRSMMHSGKHSKGRERFCLKIRDFVISEALFEQGKNVVVDDTNFNPIHEKRLRELAAKYGAEFEVKYFDTPLEECIRRDLKRRRSVGEKVIRQMYNQYLAPKVEAYVPDPKKPVAIICDIDGTLAHMTPEGRLRFGKQAPYMWENVGEDAVDPIVRDILDVYHNDYTIILLSGRDAVCKPQTERWLEENEVSYDLLLMREVNDNRKDSIVKRELFDDFIRDNFNVAFVLDDRNQVVEMWRSMGLKVLQVADGSF